MINAIKIMDDLEEAGFSQEQAKISVNSWLELMNENLATKHELKALEVATKNEFSSFRSETKNEFAAVRSEMKNEFAAVRSEMKYEFAAVRSEIKELDGKFEKLESRLTIKLGTILGAGIGILAILQKI